MSHWPRGFLFERDCVSCDSDPVCNCSSNQQCILTSRTCSQCPQIQCINKSSSSSSGINPGVIAGPVVAVLVIASLALFWWLRRKKKRDLARLEDLAQRARKAEAAGFQLSSQPGSPNLSPHTSFQPKRASQLNPPASASRRSVLPAAPVNAEYYDENGTTIRVYQGNGTINADPRSAENGGPGDPFSDRHSISTNGSSTHSTNIIPIQYIPPSRTEEGMSNAAKTLDEARRNLLKPRPGVPQRPARSPDLDLRLNAPGRESRSPVEGQKGMFRDSYLSDNSGAPSFISGNSYELYNDAPKIVTSKQVHVGRLQQAEVLQLGKPSNQLSPTSAAMSNPFDNMYKEQSERIHGSPGTFGVRSLTPSSIRSHDTLPDSLESEAPSMPGAGDLRFSLGSLAYRDSVSTMGTGRYLARDSTAPPGPRVADGPRESMFSTKSAASSFLSGFPMIPPGQNNVPPVPSSSLPQSTSSITLDHAVIGGPSATAASRPPTSFRAPSEKQIQSQTQGSRPLTATSMADSFLGTFPFVQPDSDDMARLPPPALPSAVVPDTPKPSEREEVLDGNNGKGRGVSTTSEGLGAFDFTIDGDNAPPVPTVDKEELR